MGFKFIYSEKIFVFLIASIAIFINLAPFVCQYSNNPPNQVYVGSYPILFDKTIYLAEMEQGQEENWKIINKYTTEPQKEVFIYPLYILMGHIAQTLNLSTEAMFFIGRFFFGIILLFVVIYFIRYFINSENQRKFAYLFAFLASGIGWLTQNPDSLDIWIPDAIPMVRFSYFPHFMLANVLLVVIILLIYRGLINRSFKTMAIVGILTLVLNLVLPFTSILLYFLVFSLLLILVLKNWPLVKNSLKNVLAFFAISLPSLVYMYYIGVIDPVWKMVEKQNILPTPSLVNLITGYGLILIFSFYGLRVMYKENNIKGLFFSVWVFGVFLLSYIPLWIYPMQRRFLETAFYVPLAITASYGIKGIYEYLKQKRAKDLKLKFTSFFVMFLVPFLLMGNILNWFQFKYMINQTNDPRIYLPNENIKAMEWFKDNSPAQSIILSSFYNASVIPYYANRFVYVGHGPMTINFEEKVKESENFYSGNLTGGEVLNFLRDKKINYVFYSDEEKKMGKFNPEQYDFLEKVYQNNTAEIYKVII